MTLYCFNFNLLLEYIPYLLVVNPWGSIRYFKWFLEAEYSRGRYIISTKFARGERGGVFQERIVLRGRLNTSKYGMPQKQSYAEKKMLNTEILSH